MLHVTCDMHMHHMRGLTLCVASQEGHVPQGHNVHYMCSLSESHTGIPSGSSKALHVPLTGTIRRTHSCPGPGRMCRGQNVWAQESSAGVGSRVQDLCPVSELAKEAKA